LKFSPGVNINITFILTIFGPNKNFKCFESPYKIRVLKNNNVLFWYVFDLFFNRRENSSGKCKKYHLSSKKRSKKTVMTYENER